MFLSGYTLNGELLLDAMGGEAAFSDIPAEEGKMNIHFKKKCIYNFILFLNIQRFLDIP